MGMGEHFLVHFFDNIAWAFVTFIGRVFFELDFGNMFHSLILMCVFVCVIDIIKRFIRGFGNGGDSVCIL